MLRTRNKHSDACNPHSGAQILVELDSSREEYMEQRYDAVDWNTYALYQCSLCNQIFNYKKDPATMAANESKAKKYHRENAVGGMLTQPNTQATNPRVAQKTESPLAQTFGARLLGSDSATQSVVQSRVTADTTTNFDGTIERTIVQPDGVQIFERETGTRTTHETKVTEMQATITRLERTVAKQNEERMDRELDDTRRIKSLVDKQLGDEKEMAQTARDAFISDQAAKSTHGASEMDIYLLTQMLCRYKEMFSRLEEAQRRRLLEMTSPTLNPWDTFEFDRLDSDDTRDKLNKLADSDDLFQHYCPLVAKLSTTEEVKELSLWPKKEQPMIVEESVQEEFDRVEEDAEQWPSEIDDVPMNEWREDTLEKCLTHYRSQPWKKTERTYSRQVGLPTLVAITDLQKHTAIGMHSETKRLVNERGVWRYRCLFRHPEGEEKHIWLRVTTIDSISHYRPQVRAYAKSH
jgi:hypothetical protein